MHYRSAASRPSVKSMCIAPGIVCLWSAGNVKAGGSKSLKERKKGKDWIKSTESVPKTMLEFCALGYKGLKIAGAHCTVVDLRGL